jgi:hypothetical protein
MANRLVMCRFRGFEGDLDGEAGRIPSQSADRAGRQPRRERRTVQNFPIYTHAPARINRIPGEKT